MSIFIVVPNMQSSLVFDNSNKFGLTIVDNKKIKIVILAFSHFAMQSLLTLLSVLPSIFFVVLLPFWGVFLTFNGCCISKKSVDKNNRFVQDQDEPKKDPLKEAGRLKTSNYWTR